MSGDRVLVVFGAALVGVILMGLFQLYRRRFVPEVERLDIDELGLELMAGCCAFVVFTSVTCRPCKAALRVVGAAAQNAPGPTEVTTVDAVERADLAVRYEVRTLPTVFLITASGHVVKRWTRVPEREDVDASLAAV